MYDADSSFRFSIPDGQPEDPDASTPAGSVAFRFDGHDIRYRDDGLLSLTELWKASGSPRDKRPLDWVQGDGSGFVDSISKSHEPGQSQLIKTLPGDEGEETLAHRQIGFAYASDLSPSFQMSVGDALEQWAEERDSPGLKLDRAFEAYRMQPGGEDLIEEMLLKILRKPSPMSRPAGRARAARDLCRDLRRAARGTPRFEGHRQVRGRTRSPRQRRAEAAQFRRVPGDEIDRGPGRKWQ
jgi:hypothetical protein